MLPAELEALRHRPVYFTTSDEEIIDELPIHTLITDADGFYYIKLTTGEATDPYARYLGLPIVLETYWADPYDSEELPLDDLELPITVRYIPQED